MLYERTALSKKPDETVRHELEHLRESDRMTPDLIFKDPYFLDFLGLNDRYLEKDLEDTILREMENFLLELGNGFAFLARQKRIQIDDDDFYIDLLFLHRAYPGRADEQILPFALIFAGMTWGKDYRFGVRHADVPYRLPLSIALRKVPGKKERYNLLDIYYRNFNKYLSK